MSKEFIHIFGQITVLELITIGLAITFVVQQLGKLYRKITTYHDQKQAKEQVIFELAKYNADNQIIKEAIGAMLQYRLFEECYRVIKQGYLTPSDTELINNLYEPYHKLGFNGTGTKLYLECQELPFRAE